MDYNEDVQAADQPEQVEQQDPPKDYIDKVHAALKDNLEGFDKSPDEFRRLVASDPAYRGKVYKALKENLSGFDKSQGDFDSSLGVKKKDGGGLAPYDTKPKGYPLPGLASSATDLNDFYKRAGLDQENVRLDANIQKEKERRLAMPSLDEAHSTQVAEANKTLNTYSADHRVLDPVANHLAATDLAKSMDDQRRSEQMSMNPGNPIVPYHPVNIQQYKDKVYNDPTLRRKALNQYADKNPKAAPQIQSALFTADTQNRTTPEDKAKQVEIGNQIKSGELEYAPTGDPKQPNKLIKPLGVGASIADGWENRNKTIELYDLSNDGNDKELLKRLNETAAQSNDPYRATPTPKGTVAKLGESLVGAQGKVLLETLPVNAIGNAFAEVPGVKTGSEMISSALFAHEMARVGYGNELQKSYAYFKSKGMDDNTALEQAKTQATKSMAVDAAVGGLLGAGGEEAATAAKITDKQGINTLRQAWAATKRSLPEEGKKLLGEIPQALYMGAIGAGGEMAKNISANQDGRDAMDGAGDAALNLGALHLASHIGVSIAAIARKPFTPAVRGVSRLLGLLPEGDRQAIVKEQVDNGQITQEQGDGVLKQVADDQKMDAAIGPDVKNPEVRQKMEGLINKRDAIRGRMENLDEGLHAGLKEQIKEINGKIGELASSPEAKVEPVEDKGEEPATDNTTTGAGVETAPSPITPEVKPDVAPEVKPEEKPNEITVDSKGQIDRLRERKDDNAVHSDIYQSSGKYQVHIFDNKELSVRKSFDSPEEARAFVQQYGKENDLKDKYDYTTYQDVSQLPHSLIASGKNPEELASKAAPPLDELIKQHTPEAVDEVVKKTEEAPISHTGEPMTDEDAVNWLTHQDKENGTTSDPEIQNHDSGKDAEGHATGEQQAPGAEGGDANRPVQQVNDERAGEPAKEPKQDDRQGADTGKKSKEDLSKDFDEMLSSDKLVADKKEESKTPFSDYVKKGQAVLNSLFPDHKIIVHDTTDEYAATGRSRNSAGVFNPDTKTITLNRELIEKTNSGNTVFHEVIHPIVREALESRPEAVNDAYSKLVALQKEPGMDAVWKHEDQYRDRGIGTVKVEAITEFLSLVADGKIDPSKLSKDLSTKIIDVVNRIFKALGIDKVITTASDLKVLTDTIKKAFDGDVKPLTDALGKTGDMKGESMDALKSAQNIQEWVDKHLENGQDKQDIKDILMQKLNLTDAQAERYFPSDEPGKVTGIKKEIYDAERKAAGKEVIDTASGINEKKHYEKTVDRIKSGEIAPADVDSIVKAMAEGEPLSKKVTPAEAQDIINYQKIDLNNQYDSVFKDLNKAYDIDDKAGIAQALNTQAELEAKLETNYIASKKSGSEWSAAGRARKNELNSDYSVANLTTRYRAASMGKEVPQAVKEQFAEFATKIKDLTDKVVKAEEEKEALRQQIKEAQDKKSNGEGMEKLRKEAHEARVTIRDLTKESIKKQKAQTVDAIKQKWKMFSRGQLHAGIPIPVEMIPDIAKLAKLHVMEGITNIEGVVDAIHEQLKEFMDGVDKRDIRDIISGYGRKKTLNTDETEVNLREVKRQGRLVSSLEDVQSGELPARSGLQRDEDTPRVKELKKQIKEEMVKNGIKIERSEKNPEDQWKSALDAYKTRLKNQQTQLEDVLKDGDLDKYIASKRRSHLELDQEATDLKTRVARMKFKVDEKIKQREYDNRSKVLKGLDWFKTYGRDMLVSSLYTIEKLMGAAFWRPVLKVPNDMASFFLSHTPGIKNIAKGSHEYIGSGKDLAESLGAYYGTFFTSDTYKQAFEKLKSGKSQADVLYDKPRVDIGPNDWITKLLKGYIRSHGAIKEPVKMAEMNSAFKKALAFEIRQGNDVNNPLTIAKAKQVAYLEGMRDIFSQDNDVVKLQRMVEAMLDKKHPYTTKLIQMELPITKIASNYVSEIGSLTVGGIRALPKTLQAVFKGIDSLKPEEKDFVIRNMRKNMVGLSVYMIGYFGYKSIAPFFGTTDKNEKHPPDNEVFGITPHLTHNPVFDVLRAGATYRWINEQALEQAKEANKGEAFAQISMGLLKQSPYVDQTLRLSQTFTGKNIKDKATNFAAEFISQRLIPPDVRKIAESQDEIKPAEIGVKPEGFLQAIEMKIPYVRQMAIKDAFQKLMDKREKETTPAEDDAKEKRAEKREAAADAKEAKIEELAKKLNVKYIPK